MKGFEEGKTISELGIDVNRKFKLVEDFGYFKKGDVVKLLRDDGTSCPIFGDENADDDIPLSYLYYADEDTFELGEQVAVSYRSEEDALEEIKSNKYKYYYTGGIDMDGDYIVEGGEWYFSTFKYIAKIPTKKQITIEVSEEQEKFINDYLEIGNH